MDNLPNVGEVTSDEKAGLFIPPDRCTCDERKAKALDVADALGMKMYVYLDEITLEPDFKASLLDVARRCKVAEKRLREIFA